MGILHGIPDTVDNNFFVATNSKIAGVCSASTRLQSGPSRSQHSLLSLHYMIGMALVAKKYNIDSLQGDRAEKWHKQALEAGCSAA